MHQQSSFKDYILETKLFTSRALFAALFVFILLLLLISRMFHLQIIEHAKYRTESRDNRVKLRPMAPTRGQIYDRNGLVLARNRLTYTLEIIPDRVKKFQDLINRLSQVITISEQDIKRYKQIKQQRRRFDAVPIRSNLDESELARFAVDSYQFPEVMINAVPIREYPLKEHMAHILGYVGRISERDLEKVDATEYSGTTHVGKTGIELSYESQLHGEVGLQRVEVNAAGRPLRTLDQTPPKPGQDLHLHIDTRLQQITEEAFGEYNGSAVAIDVESGGVVAMVSKPGFDPNLFVEGISSTAYQQLLHSPDKPLYNRSVKGTYPPGSTVKPFVAWAGLDSGVIDINTRKSCPGYFQLPGGSHKYRCWNKLGHGSISMETAIKSSCDVYFYELAIEMGIDRLQQHLANFGFGRKSGLDLIGEQTGVLPSREWKQATYKKAWFPGETVISGIGQGYYLVTPAQLASATAALAAGGIFRSPRLVAFTQQGVDAKPVPVSSYQHRFSMNPLHLSQVVSAMVQVIEGVGGTAKNILNNDYRIAGKTGTAQVVSIKQNEEYDEDKIPKEMRDHALFIAFAPAEHPRIAVAVIVENGGHGGSTAAPIAKAIMDYYLLGKVTETEPSTKDLQ